MPKREKSRGFTLIEIIAVLILIAIMSVIAVSKITSTAQVNLKATAEELKSNIRYVQLRAMSMSSQDTTCNAAFGISTTSNSYFMFRDCNTSNKVVLPGASSNTITLPTGMTLTTVNYINFNNWGSPCTNQLGSPPAASNIILSLTSSSVAQSETITITKNTGYVP